jgi:hypothetical protein
MNIDYYLPRPTEDELELGNKVDYFKRIIELELHKKHKITLNELTFWIHHNFTAVFLLDEELSLTAIKKLIKLK